jgi:hypothetical protein
MSLGYDLLMRRISTNTGDQLAGALHALGVNFILGGEPADDSLHKHPARLIAALAQSNESRLRLALIPLFIEHPELASHVRGVIDRLDLPAQLTLQCYYSAAVWLQQEYRWRLNKLIGERPSLPDYFSRDLGVQVTTDPDKNLELLAQRHQALSGARVNWLGTYRHAMQVWLRGLELQSVG